MGLLLVAPAVIAALVSLAVPSLQTIWTSLRQASPLRGSERFVGLENYGDVLGSGGFWRALGFSFSLAVIPLFVAVAVAPVLAVALDGAGPWPRRVGRVLLSVPLVVFSPVAIAVAWMRAQRPGSPGSGVAGLVGTITDPDEARLAVPLMIGAATFGAVLGLALIVFLAALRGRAEGRSVAPAMLAVGAITVLAALAVSLQAFSFSTLIRTRNSSTVSSLWYQDAFLAFRFGPAAATQTIVGLILGLLGVTATVIVIKARLRIRLMPSAQAPKAWPAPQQGPPAPQQGPPAAQASPPGRFPPQAGGLGAKERAATPGGMVVGVLALLVVVTIAVVGMWPWLSAVFASTPEGSGPRLLLPTPTWRIHLNTWLPPVLGAAVSVGIAFLAALGIGGLRPMGRRSEWLLLPFAPWLFVGVGPLAVADYVNARDLGLVGDFAALFPPILISVPALVILTLFCRGHSAKWRALSASGAPPALSFLRVVVVPALPLAGLLAGAVALVGAQGLLWPLLMGSESEQWTAPVALVSRAAVYAAMGPSVGSTTPLVAVILALIVLAVLQILYLDRLAILAGRPDEIEEDPHKVAPPQHWAPMPPHGPVAGPMAGPSGPGPWPPPPGGVAGPSGPPPGPPPWQRGPVPGPPEAAPRGAPGPQPGPGRQDADPPLEPDGDDDRP